MCVCIYAQRHTFTLSWDFIVIWIFKRSPGNSNGQESLGITLIKNNLRDGVRRPLLIRWSEEGLLFIDEEKKTTTMRRTGEEYL